MTDQMTPTGASPEDESGNQSEYGPVDSFPLKKEEAPEADEITPKKGKKSKNEKQKNTLGQEILSWGGTLLMAVVIAMAIRALLFEPIRVDGESMINTLQNGEIVLVTKPNVLLGKLNRGDVIICRFPNRNKVNRIMLGAPLDIKLVGHELFVKRLVALPGDSVAVLSGKLYVNDALVEEDFVDYPSRSDYPRRVLEENEYMVMGDNRASSHDSRARDVGPITKDMIVGHATFVLFPFSRMRPVN